MCAVGEWWIEEVCVADKIWPQQQASEEQMQSLVETNSMNVEIEDEKKLVVQNSLLERAVEYPITMSGRQCVRFNAAWK